MIYCFLLPDNPDRGQASIMINIPKGIFKLQCVDQTAIMDNKIKGCQHESSDLTSLMKVLQIICRTQILMNIIITSYLTGSEAENNHFSVAIEHLRNIQDLVYPLHT